MSRHATPLRRTLCYSTIDGAACAMMIGAGESNIVVFGLALGIHDVVAGLLGAIPMLAGSVVQLLTPMLVRRLGSHKKFIVLAVFLQAASFVPLIIGALTKAMPTWSLFSVASVYFSVGLAAGSAWNTFIGSAVPPACRARYFALRNRALNFATLAATLWAGWLLRAGREHNCELLAFAALFGFAGLARAVSGSFMALQIEREPLPEGHRDVPWAEMIGRYLHGFGGRVLAAAVAMQLALQISTRFLQPYLIEHLRLNTNYAVFGMLIAAEVLAKAVALPFWGRVAHKHGPLRVMTFGSLALIPIPILWMLGTSPGYLLCVQFTSGFALSAWELAIFLGLLQSVRHGERTSVMTSFQLANSGALVGGALIGAGVLEWFGDGHRGYMAVFGASLVARFIALAFVARARPRPGEIERALSAGPVGVEVHAAPGGDLPTAPEGGPVSMPSR